MLSSLKKNIKKIVFRFIKPETRIYYSSYSQSGEDIIVRFLFDSIGIVKPTYLELGVFKPDIGSNTYLFYQLGSRGVCVEADSSLIGSINATRGEDKVLNLAVGVGDSKEVDFFIFDDPSLNTMDREEAEFRQKQGTHKVVKTVKIKTLELNKIIERNFKSRPDFLSIDIEGLDLPVLKSLDLERFPIPVVCAETCTYSENYIRPKNLEIQNFMENNGYFVYADTYINTIFVNRKWFNSGKN